MREIEPSRRLPSAVRSLAAEQAEVTTRGQLARLGISAAAVHARTSHGIWRDIGPRAVVLHNGPLTTLQRFWVGALHGGRDSALTLATAAEVGGLRGFEELDVHVCVRHGREVDDVVHPLVTVRVHQSRHVQEDVVPLRQPARQSIARACVELASQARSDNRTRAVVAAVVQQRLVRPDQLQDVVNRRPTLPKRALIRETIDDVAGGAHSLPELDYQRALRRAGLPQPTRQRIGRRPNGIWYLDNDFDEWAVTVEINGQQHHTLLAREADDLRRVVLQARKRIVVDISSYIARRRPRLAVLMTAEALMARGYRPTRRVAAALAAYAEQEDWANRTALTFPPIA